MTTTRARLFRTLAKTPIRHLVRCFASWEATFVRETETPSPVPYIEREEAGPANLQVKLERVARGEPFEWPNIVALNQCVAHHFVRDAKSIVELGAGTGCFAHAAATDPTRRIVCSEFDTEALQWAQTNRPHPNVEYTSSRIEPGEHRFDLVVAIEVIEHVADFPGFLSLCASLGHRTVITTPNKRRAAETDTIGPPEYYQHVREWSAGELYWVARCFFEDVRLFAMPDQFVPECAAVDVNTRQTPLIAECTKPRNR